MGKNSNLVFLEKDLLRDIYDNFSKVMQSESFVTGFQESGDLLLKYKPIVPQKMSIF
jgi:hypothetical protein